MNSSQALSFNLAVSPTVYQKQITDLWREEFLYILLELVCKEAMFLSSIYDFCFIFILWVMTSLFSLLLQLSHLCNVGHSFRLTIKSKYILSFQSLNFKGQFSHYGRIWRKVQNFSILPTPDDPMQCPPPSFMVVSSQVTAMQSPFLMQSSASVYIPCF